MIITCRDESSGEEAANEIREKTGSKKVVVRKLDLASFESVKNFASVVKNGEYKYFAVNILISARRRVLCHCWRVRTPPLSKLSTGSFRTTNARVETAPRHF